MVWQFNRQNFRAFILCYKSQNKCFNKLERLVPPLKTLWELTPSCRLYLWYWSTSFPWRGTRWPTITRSDQHMSPAAPQGMTAVEPQFFLVSVSSQDTHSPETHHMHSPCFSPPRYRCTSEELSGDSKAWAGCCSAALLWQSSARYLYFLWRKSARGQIYG